MMNTLEDLYNYRNKNKVNNTSDDLKAYRERKANPPIQGPKTLEETLSTKEPYNILDAAELADQQEGQRMLEAGAEIPASNIVNLSEQPKEPTNFLEKVGKWGYDKVTNFLSDVTNKPSQTWLDSAIKSDNVTAAAKLGLATANSSKDVLLNTSSAIRNGLLGRDQKWKSDYSAVDYLKEGGADLNKISNPVARGFAIGGAELVSDPLTFFGGGVIDDISKVKRLEPGAVYSITEAAKQGENISKNIPFSNNTQINTVDDLRNKYTPKNEVATARLSPEPTQANVNLPPLKKSGQNVTQNAKIYGKDINILSDEGDGIARYTIKDETGRDVNVAMDKAKFDKLATDIKPIETKMVGIEPEIPQGKKERGFSDNTRTDINNPDNLRDSYTENPLSYEQLGNPTTLAKAQKIFDEGFESARTQLTGLAERMQPEAIPLAKLLSRKAAEEGNLKASREIIADVAEKLTQAGQFSQAARILRESDPETLLMTIDKQLRKLNKEGAETYGKKWKDFDLTPDELEMVSKVERGNQASYETAFEAIQKRIANEMPSNATEKINAWRHMSMLLNPKTHIRNVGGNAIMMGMRKAAQRISGVGQKFLKPEDRTQAVFLNKEYKQAANDYFEANKKDLLSGANKYQEGISMNMPDKRVFKNNALESVRKFNYDLLAKGDNPFFKSAYVDRLASYAQAKGIKDFSKLGQEAFDIAKLEAEQATYKDASVIANFLNKIKHPGKDASLGQKIGAVITEAALPFTKTPINIIKRGIQYSPAGIINGLSKIKDAKTAASAIDEMAKGLTGTGILGLGYLLAKGGVLTGKAENDVDLREYNKNTGNSPFSVLGKYTYDWMQPFSVPLTVGVQIYNAVKDKPEDMKKLDALIKNNDISALEQMSKKFANGILDSFSASGDTVFDMSIMKGIRNLLGSGYKGFMEGLAQAPQGYAMQFVPSVLSQTAGVIDPTVRQTYYKGDVPNSVKATAMSKIPFASTYLQAKQTPWGEDVKRSENVFTRMFSQYLSPGIISQVQNVNPDVDNELRRLNKVGEVIQFPTVPSNSFTWKGQQFDMTPEEYTDFQKTLGQNTLTAYEDTIKSSEYLDLSDKEKAKELSDLISDAKALAKFQLIKNKGLANSPEIMDVPEKFTRTAGQKKQEYPLSFQQQNELADQINKYKKQYSINKRLTQKQVEDFSKEKAYNEMKSKVFK